LVLKIFWTFFLGLFFLGCSHDTSSHSQESIDTTKSYALLGPISGGVVNLREYEGSQEIFQGKTTLYNGENFYMTGSFALEVNSTLVDDVWLVCSITGGEDIDSDDDGIVSGLSPLKGTMLAYVQAKDIRNTPLIVNALTTFGAYMYAYCNDEDLSLEAYLNQIAKRIFRKTLNSDDTIDYKDLFAYRPYDTADDVFINPSFYKNLLQNGFMQALLQNENMELLLRSDEDNDKLLWGDELLYGSDVTKADTNNDGIDDYEAFTRGLSPFTTDSDGDRLEDYDEIYRYHTNPLLSDSDEDYLPDGVEVTEGSNPLDGDSDANGIADGLDGDPFFYEQWYIQSEGSVVANTAGVATVIGNDLGILPLYHHYIGGDAMHKIIVQVVDTGVEKSHEDLDVNEEYSLNAITHTNDPTATTEVPSGDLEAPIDVGHGTAVAGIIAARTNNGLGVRGIIPRGEIAGSNWLEDQTLEEVKKVWIDVDEKVVVSNNSWGTYIFDDMAFEKVLEEASHLRDEKGRIFVFASGNFREDFGNANLSYLANNPYVLTVAALNHQDKVASYSNPGSNVLVSAYGGEHYYSAPTIMTTLLMGKSFYENEIPQGDKGSITLDEDTQRNYTFAMNGTSAATPIVSGIVALTLEACPNLSYRDMRWLIAHTALHIDTNNTTWIQNSAGLWHSLDYGFGKINPVAMVQRCQSRDFHTLAPLRVVEKTLEVNNQLIPDTNTTITQTIFIDDNISLEWVGLKVSIDHQYAGDLEIVLTSPQGTQSILIEPCDLLYNAYKEGFRFSTLAFMDESSYGQWKISITDRLPNDYGYLSKIVLEVRGH